MKESHKAVVESVQSIVPDKLITELEAEIIEGRRAFLVLADSLAQYRHYVRKYFTTGEDSYSYTQFSADVNGLLEWTDGFFERFSETGFIVDFNGHLAHESQAETPTLFPDETPPDASDLELSDPHIIGG